MKNKFKILIILGIILIIIVFLNKDTKRENGNISNMGLAIQYDGTVYYNKYEKGIFSNKNGNEEQLTDETAYSLNILDEKIYYLTVADFNNVVIKYYDIKEKSVKNVAEIHTSISKFMIHDNYIYYLNNVGEIGLAKMDLNGQNPQTIVKGNIRDFQVAKDYIFYINESNKICKISISGAENCVLNDEISANKIQVVDGWIYYYNETENALFRIDIVAKKNELVSVLVNNEIYNVSGKYVYYVDKQNSKISRMQIGKSNKCDEIVDISISKTKINIAGDEIYYLDKSQDESQAYQMYRVKLDGNKTKSIEY